MPYGTYGIGRVAASAVLVTLPPGISGREQEADCETDPYVPPAPLPAGLVRRDVKVDEQFDVGGAAALRPAVAAFPQQPRIVSSAHGPIRHVMLWYPPVAEGLLSYRSIYEQLLRTLPAAARVTIVTHPGEADDLASLVRGARSEADTQIVTTPDYLAFTVWAEDACVVVEDMASTPPTTYLLEPATFPRAGDMFLPELVAQATEVQATQVPLSFQGGNVLIGDDFVLIGRDYLDESVAGILDLGAVDDFPYDGTAAERERATTALFRRTFDPDRVFHFLESTPRDRPRDRIVRRNGERWLESIAGGRGARQPIFHIDMFVSLAGREEPSGRYVVLIGDPARADELLGWEPVAHDLQAEFDQIAAQLAALGFEVRRTPLPYLPALLRGPVAGAGDVVGEIRWYHATSNNCLVQIDGAGKEVWLPTYGHGDNAELEVADREHQRIWEDLGFTVHLLGNFHPFAMQMGAVHCIKKYLAR